MAAPFVGLHGLPRLMSGEHVAGFWRLAAGLLLVLFVVGFYGWGIGFGMLLFDPLGFLFMAVLVVGGYLFLWIEGMVHAFKRLPPLL